MATAAASPPQPKRSTSHSRSHPPSRPTTPLRPASRSSLRASQQSLHHGSSSTSPVESLEPAFAELSDSMADLEANFMHLQLMHESLSRFSENFAAFLYGLNMNAFCVDFPEVPIAESFKRAHLLSSSTEPPVQNTSSNNMYANRNPNRQVPRPTTTDRPRPHYDPADDDVTIMTTASSFVDHPPTAVSKPLRTPTRSTSRSVTHTPSRTASRVSSVSSRGPVGARGLASTATAGRGRGTGGGSVTGVRETRASMLARVTATAKVKGGGVR